MENSIMSITLKTHVTQCKFRFVCNKLSSSGTSKGKCSLGCLKHINYYDERWHTLQLVFYLWKKKSIFLTCSNYRYMFSMKLYLMSNELKLWTCHCYIKMASEEARLSIFYYFNSIYTLSTMILHLSIRNMHYVFFS